MAKSEIPEQPVHAEVAADIQDHASRGLRARKIAQAKLAVEHAAFTIALERGYEHATVEAICEAADISQRTFFNYFGSKDGVFLGAGPAALDDVDAQGFIDGTGSIVGDLITAIANTMVDKEPDPAVFEMRHKLAKSSPEFAKALIATMNSVEEAHIALIRKRFAVQNRPGTEHELDDEARMVVALATGAMRFVMRRWFEGNLEPTPRRLQTLLRHATELVHRATAD